MRARWILLLTSTLAVWPGCRCGPSTPPEPTASSTPRPSAATPCPVRPEWAGAPPEPLALVAELLMQPEQESTRNGTGIRVYSDGRVFAYDEAVYDTKDGKLASRPIPGKWRQHRSVPSARVDELKALIDGQERDGLVGWQGAKRKAKGRASYLTLRASQHELSSCYRGGELGERQRPVEAMIKKIMGEAFSMEVNNQ